MKYFVVEFSKSALIIKSEDMKQARFTFRKGWLTVPKYTIKEITLEKMIEIMDKMDETEFKIIADGSFRSTSYSKIK